MKAEKFPTSRESLKRLFVSIPRNKKSTAVRGAFVCCF